jgi:hypothetical protein
MLTGQPRGFMKNTHRTAFILCVSALTISACLHTQDGAYRNPPRDIVVTMIEGNAVVYVKGHVSEKLHFNERNSENRYDSYKGIAVKQEVITREETIDLFEGQDVTYNIWDSEIISFNFKVYGEKDLRIRVKDWKDERFYTLKKDDKLGLLISRGN